MKFKILIVFILSTFIVLSGVQTVNGLEEDNVISRCLSNNRGLNNHDYTTYSKPSKLPLYNPLYNIVDKDSVKAGIDVENQEFILSNKSNEKVEIDLSSYDFPIDKVVVNKNIELTINRKDLREFNLKVKEVLSEVEVSLVFKKPNDILDDRLLITVDSDIICNFNVPISEKFEKDANDLSIELSKGKKIIQDEIKYTDLSYGLFIEVYADAKTLFDKISNNEIVLSNDLSDLLSRYTKAISNLVLAGSFENLSYLINQEYARINGDWYTEYAVNILVEEIENLYEIMDKRISKDEIETYIMNFEMFIDELDKVIEMHTYNKFLNFVKDLDLDLYTEESVEVYLTAKKLHIEEMNLYDPREKLITSLEELDDTYIKLIEAYKNLVLKEIIEIEDEEIIEDEIIDEDISREIEVEEKLSEVDVKKDTVNTSSSNYYNQYILLILVSLLSILGINRYKKIK